VKLLFSTSIGLLTLGVVVALSVLAFVWIRYIMDLDV